MNKKPLNKGMTSILIICNEASTAPVWGYIIREKKLRAVIQTDPQNAIQHCKEEEPALAILDLQLPPSKILDLYRKLRAICENPILLFLPAYDENLIIEYYDAGLDDCVVKPISPMVFYAKVKAWLRHSKMLPVPAMDELRAGKTILKPDQRQLVKSGGGIIKLTSLEVRLLYLLMSQPGHVFDNTYIINKVWGLYGEQDLSLLKHAVYRLRRKLEEDPKNPRWIQSWHGKGYNFNSD
jgi:DNA-binding response OmpR family regulator